MFDERSNGLNENGQAFANNMQNSSGENTQSASDVQNTPAPEFEPINIDEINKAGNASPVSQQAQQDYSQNNFTPFENQPPVTEERPVVDSLPNHEPNMTAGTEYYGGTAYTRNVDGNSTSGYEWNDSAAKAYSAKKAKSNSGKGFKIFVGAVLSVFTLSVVALTLMVVNYTVGGGELFNGNTDFSDGLLPDGDAPKSNSTAADVPDVPASSSNFVVYDKDELAGQVLTIPQIAAKCSPSSVGIVSQVEVSYSYPFGFGTSKSLSEASGSGFIYSSDGYIITNHHVIENAKQVTVILHDGTQHEAEIIGSDSLSDIAVLKITPAEGTPLTPMEIGNSDELVVGESVVAIGCPAGIEFIGTVTDGIVSAINRNVEITDNYGTVQKTMTLIQTNATINQGNSGGPLINTRGQVIGINTLKLNSSSYEGIGFSIPMNGAMPVIKQLIEHGKVIERTQDDFAYGKGVIGITGSAISEDEAEYYNIPLGVLVVQIDKNSSASKAGLRRGDIITHYNGKKVSSVEEINEAKGSGRAGEEVTVTVYRDSESGSDEGDTFDITFTLDAQK